MTTQVKTVVMQPSTAVTATAGATGKVTSGLGWASRFFCVLNVTAITGTLRVGLQASPDANLAGTTYDDFLVSTDVTTVTKVIMAGNIKVAAGAPHVLADLAVAGSVIQAAVPDQVRVRYSLVTGPATFSVTCLVE